MSEITVSYLQGVISMLLAFYVADGIGKLMFLILGLACFAVATYAED